MTVRGEQRTTTHPGTARAYPQGQPSLAIGCAGRALRTRPRIAAGHDNVMIGGAVIKSVAMRNDCSRINYRTNNP